MAKPSNDILKEYELLEGTIKAASARMTEIRDMCKEYGTFSTKEFVVDVEECSRRQLAGLKEMTKIISEAELEKYGLIKTVSYQTVKISRKKSDWFFKVKQR